MTSLAGATELSLHPDHPHAAGSTKDLSDFAGEPLILYDASPSTINIIEAFAALVGRGVRYGLLMSRPSVLPMSVEGRPVAVLLD